MSMNLNSRESCDKRLVNAANAGHHPFPTQNVATDSADADRSSEVRELAITC
jgi:hypothetical protein